MGVSKNCFLALQVPITKIFSYTRATKPQCSNKNCNQNVEKYQFCPDCGTKKSITEWYTNLKTGEVFDDKENIKILGYNVYIDWENYPDDIFFRFAGVCCNTIDYCSIDIDKLNEFKAKLVSDGLWGELGRFGMFVEFC